MGESFPFSPFGSAFEKPKQPGYSEQLREVQEELRAVERKMEAAEVARDNFSAVIAKIEGWFPETANDYAISDKLDSVTEYLNKLRSQANESDELLRKEEIAKRALLKKMAQLGN